MIYADLPSLSRIVVLEVLFMPTVRPSLGSESAAWNISVPSTITSLIVATETKDSVVPAAKKTLVLTPM